MDRINTQTQELQGNDITQAFAGLPLGLLLCQPLLEAAKGQLAMCQVYIQTIAGDHPPGEVHPQY